MSVLGGVGGSNNHNNFGIGTNAPSTSITSTGSTRYNDSLTIANSSGEIVTELPVDLTNVLDMTYTLIEELVNNDIISPYEILINIEEYGKMKSCNEKTEHVLKFLVNKLSDTDKILFKLDKEDIK